MFIDFDTSLTVIGLASGVGSGKVVRDGGKLAVAKVAAKTGIHVDDVISVGDEIFSELTLNNAADISTFIKNGKENIAQVYDKMEFRVTKVKEANLLALNKLFEPYSITTKGKAGEAVANGIEGLTKYNFTNTLTNKKRIADHKDDKKMELWEVKNVNYQAYTSQLKDTLAESKRLGYKMVLKVRESTQLSQPLQDAVNRGEINLVRMSNEQLLNKCKELQK